MNALRQIVVPQNGRLWIDVPKEFSQKRVEVIVLPVEGSIAVCSVRIFVKTTKRYEHCIS